MRGTKSSVLLPFYGYISDLTKGSYADGEWHYFVALVDETRSTASLYLDGTLSSSYTYPSIVASLAASTTLNGNFLYGKGILTDTDGTSSSVEYFHVGID